MSRRPLLPLILLDRDGTLIVEREYLSDPAGVKLLPGVSVGMKRLKRAGFCVAVVSNQSGVGRGLMTLTQLKRVNQRFLQLLRRTKAAPDGVYWCPHGPSARCPCRKPKLGMVKCAGRDLHVPWKKSISVGDRPSDVQLGQKTGGQGILVLTGYGKKHLRQWPGRRPDHIAKNFRQAVDWILKMKVRSGYGQ